MHRAQCIVANQYGHGLGSIFKTAIRIIVPILKHVAKAGLRSFCVVPQKKRKRDRRDSKEDEREGQGGKKNRKECEETEEIKTFPLYPYLIQE